MLATNRPRRFAHTLYSLLLVTCFQISDTYAPCTAIVPSTRSALATWHRSRHARAALAAPSTWRGTLETGKVDDKQDFTVAVSTVMGVEGVVKQELSALGYDGYPVGASGRVELTGGSKAIIDCNLHLRSATRVMLVLAQFTATTFDELFDGTAAIHWADYIHRGAAFPVRGKSVKSTLTSVPACQSIVKKAIITKLLSADPSRAAANAEGWLQEDARTGLCGVEVSIQKDEVTISLDTSGDALHRRGYRSGVLQGGAPLKETLAASMLMISDWTPDRPLLDPFCGSGTILLEAALMAHKMPPGLRRSFAAEKWPLVCPPGEWERARQEAQAQVVLSPPARIYGADIDRRAVEMTYQHLQAAGLDKTVQLSVSDVHDLPPPPGAYGCVVTNPPYGERLGGAASANEGIGRLMRQLHDRHWSLFALSGDMEFEAHVGRTSDKRRKLYNGKLPCQLFHYVSAPPPRPRAPRRSKPGLSPPASGKTGEAAPGVRDAQQKEGRAGDWHCPRCKTYVFGSKASCLKCGYEKRNDWACPSCQSLVFASKLACFKCGTHRAPEGPGSRGGGKPKGGAGSGHGAGGGLGKGGGEGVARSAVRPGSAFRGIQETAWRPRTLDGLGLLRHRLRRGVGGLGVRWLAALRGSRELNVVLNAAHSGVGHGDAEAEGASDWDAHDQEWARVGGWVCMKKCGACCFLAASEPPDDADAAAQIRDMTGHDGWCRHFDKELLSCRIHETKPAFCRTSVASFQQLYGVPPDEFEAVARSSCCEAIIDVYGADSQELARYKTTSGASDWPDLQDLLSDTT